MAPRARWCGPPDAGAGGAGPGHRARRGADLRRRAPSRARPTPARRPRRPRRPRDLLRRGRQRHALAAARRRCAGSSRRATRSATTPSTTPTWARPPRPRRGRHGAHTAHHPRAHSATPGAEVPYFRAPNGSVGVTGAVAVTLGMQPLGLGNVIDDWDACPDRSAATSPRTCARPSRPGPSSWSTTAGATARPASMRWHGSCRRSSPPASPSPCRRRCRPTELP